MNEIKKRCKLHPQFKGIRKSISKCVTCVDIWTEHQQKITPSSMPLCDEHSSAILLNHGLYAVVDLDMLPILSQFNWHIDKGRGNQLYVSMASPLGSMHTRERMHWYVVGRPSRGFVVDHINGDGLDNRRTNLRIITVRENGQNRTSHRDGRLVGCYFNKAKGKWQASIKIDGHRKSLGRFETEKDAHKKYREAVASLEAYRHGEERSRRP